MSIISKLFESVCYNTTMNIEELTQKMLYVKKLYTNFENKKLYKNWTTEETYQGLVSDVGDLGRLVLAKEGFREMPDIEEKLQYELAEILYATLFLANSYNIDLTKAFLDEMSRLEQNLSKEIAE